MTASMQVLGLLDLGELDIDETDSTYETIVNDTQGSIYQQEFLLQMHNLQEMTHM